MKLYIISNRLPVKVTSADGTFSFVRSEGGLTTGLNSLQIPMRNTGSVGQDCVLTKKRKNWKLPLNWIK